MCFALILACAETGITADSGSVLRVRDLGEPPIELSMTDLTGLPQSSVDVTDEAGERVTYTGTSVADILNRAGVQLGKTLRGKRLAEYLLVEARDGYRVVFALPEIDALFRDRKITLAYLKNGKPLPEAEGALRVIYPEEKRFARWIRQVVSIAVGSAAADGTR